MVSILSRVRKGWVLSLSKTMSYKTFVCTFICTFILALYPIKAAELVDRCSLYQSFTFTPCVWHRQRCSHNVTDYERSCVTITLWCAQSSVRRKRRARGTAPQQGRLDDVLTPKWNLFKAAATRTHYVSSNARHLSATSLRSDKLV